MTCLLTFPYLFALFFSVSCLEKYYTINRISTPSLSNEVDVFDVPESQCPSISQCSNYNNTESSATGPACKCTCLSNASTFGLLERSWSCLKNTEMRAQSGCQFMFIPENDEDPFRILKKNESPLPTAVLPSKQCSIDMPSSKYFTCDGTWAELDPNGTTANPLRISVKKSQMSNPEHHEYSFKVIDVASLKGKIISLQFRCTRNGGMLQSSCLVFKMEGAFKCPVNLLQSSSTKKPVVKPTTFLFSLPKPSHKTPGVESEEDEGKEASSGTIAAVVVIVFFAILLAAFIGFVIWKRKRGENLRIIEQLARLGNGKQVEPDENIYAEVAQQSHVRPTQTRTDVLTKGINNDGFGDSASKRLQQYDGSLYAEADFLTTNEHSVDDAEGYLVPVDYPLYLELQPPKESIQEENPKSENVLLNSLPDDAESFDLHSYEVLDDPNDQTTNGYAGTSTAPQSDTPEESCSGRVGSSNGSPTATTRPSAAGNKGPVAKERRRPPSPPRKEHKAISSSDKDNKHDKLNIRTDEHGALEDNRLDNHCKSNMYESLKEDERVTSIYETLDRTNDLNK